MMSSHTKQEMVVLCLNGLQELSNFRFLAVTSGHRFVLSEQSAILEHPEIQFDIVELRNEISMLGCFHEIGHAQTYLKILNLVKSNDDWSLASLKSQWPLLSCYIKNPRYLPRAPSLEGNLTLQLIKATSWFWHFFPKENFNIFKERSAWAYAFYATRKHGLLSHISQKDLRNYHIRCLGSYGDSYLTSPSMWTKSEN